MSTATLTRADAYAAAPVDFVDQRKTMIDGHARYSGVCPNCGLRGAFCEAPR